jgi:hypothetical protein
MADLAQVADIFRPIPSATRRGVPNKFASTGMLWPAGRLNKIAGPSARKVRSQTSVISRCVKLLYLTCFSSSIVAAEK